MVGVWTKPHPECKVRLPCAQATVLRMQFKLSVSIEAEQVSWRRFEASTDDPRSSHPTPIIPHPHPPPNPSPDVSPGPRPAVPPPHSAPPGVLSHLARVPLFFIPPPPPPHAPRCLRPWCSCLTLPASRCSSSSTARIFSATTSSRSCCSSCSTSAQASPRASDFSAALSCSRRSFS